MKYCIPLLVLILFSRIVLSQNQSSSSLFSENDPLKAKLTIGVKEIKGIESDTIYTSNFLYYQTDDSAPWDSVKIAIRARGEFRRKECYYPPLRIKIKKKDRKETIFEEDKNLKLVMPCRPVKDNSLILREYLCYKMYEPISKYTFSVRMVDLDFTDDKGKKSKSAEFMSFFIEDDEVVAKRHGGKVIEGLNLHPKALEDSNAIRHDMFQYMIANTDWSTTFLHNAKLIQLDESKEYVPLTYDFDMAGFVDAPYAVVNPTLGITSVRDRVYRGFCRSEDIVQAIRKEYLEKEGEIMGAMKELESRFDAREYDGLVKYMDEFFGTFKDDTKFKNSIIDKCRTK